MNFLSSCIFISQGHQNHMTKTHKEVGYKSCTPVIDPSPTSPIRALLVLVEMGVLGKRKNRGGRKTG